MLLEIKELFPFIGSLNDQEFNQFKNSIIEVKYKNGETICKQGSFTSHAVFIKYGRAKLIHEHKVKNLILKIAQSGEIIELPSLYDDSIFKYSVIAIENCSIWLVDKGVISNLILSNSAFSFELLKILNRLKFEIIERFTCMNQKQAHGRIADIILYLSERIYKSNDFEITLSRKDLAELTGMSTETVVRILKEFKCDGLIKMNGKKIEINSYSLLKKLSEVG